MSTIQTQEDSESFDFLTGLPMRSRGEKLMHNSCSNIADASSS